MKNINAWAEAVVARPTRLRMALLCFVCGLLLLVQGGCALLAAGAVGAVVAEDVQPIYYEPPPIFYGPVWRPQPYFRPPFHRRLKRAPVCPAECKSKRQNPFAWQVCISFYLGASQTCVPAK